MSRLARVLAAVVGAGYLATGLWALIAPDNWAHNYPGFGRHWLTAADATSPHLLADAAAGFVGVGVALVAGSLIGHRVAGQVAGLALAAHALPHFIHHISHPDHDLPTFDVVVGVWGIAVQAAIGVWLFVSSRRRELT